MITSLNECDQAIFAWVDKKGQLGHQFVSKSSGLTSDEVSFLQNFNTPVSLDNLNFKECIRFFSLPSGRMCINLVKSLGRDLKGREGALLSHFIIMDRDTMEATGGDYEGMDASLLHNIKSSRDLEKLKTKDGDFYPLPKIRFNINPLVKPEIALIKITTTLPRFKNMLYGYLISILNQNYRMIIKDNTDESRHKFIWTFLQLFPNNARFSSYSSALYNPLTDFPFTVSVSNNYNGSQIPDVSFVSINDDNSIFPLKNDGINVIAYYLASIVFKEDIQSLYQIWDKYNNMSNKSYSPSNLILSIANSFLETSSSDEDKLKVILETIRYENTENIEKRYELIETILYRNPNHPEFYDIVSIFYLDLFIHYTTSQKDLFRNFSTVIKLFLKHETGIQKFKYFFEPFIENQSPLINEQLNKMIINQTLLDKSVSPAELGNIILINKKIENMFLNHINTETVPSRTFIEFCEILYIIDPKGKLLYEKIRDVFEIWAKDVLGLSRILSWSSGNIIILSRLDFNEVLKLMKFVLKQTIKREPPTMTENLQKVQNILNKLNSSKANYGDKSKEIDELINHYSGKITIEEDDKIHDE
ncbi:MAG: hypothetical protein ACYDAO_08965 [Thermoplasmataceae archaeon]